MINLAHSTVKFILGFIFISGLSIGHGQDKPYKYIDENKVLFGVEYSFQDREIVNEPGRMTFRTPHKAEKMEALFSTYLKKMNLDRKVITSDTSFGDFKPGYQFAVPDDGIYTINMEPVTIEVNTTPKTINQIVKTSQPIFDSVEEVGLKPYVNPAAERSGMGHIHVGGRTFGESPFVKNPNLLRNLLVYYHKHPSLLYGFAEAYDIGNNSNIETYHKPERQKAFQRVVEDFDEWYLQTRKSSGDINKGLEMFMKLLKKHEPPGNNEFFHHYRNINLEHLKIVATNPPALNKEGKFTVEFRGFRPQKSPQHAHANAQLLLDLMDTLSDPDHLEEFKVINSQEFNRFWSSGKVQADWNEVKQQIGHKNPFSDEMVKEFSLAVESTSKKPFKEIPEAKVYGAYSIKEDKGKAFEIRIPASENGFEPEVTLNNKKIDLEKIRLGRYVYWTGYIDTKTLKINPVDLLAGNVPLKVSKFGHCNKHSVFGLLNNLLLQKTIN